MSFFDFEAALIGYRTLGAMEKMLGPQAEQT